MDLATFYLSNDDEPDPPGVTSGHMVIWSPGSEHAYIAPAVALVDDEGTAYTQTAEFRPTRIVPDEESGS